MGGRSRFLLLAALLGWAGCAEAPRPPVPGSMPVQSSPLNGPAGTIGRIEHAPSDSLPINAFRSMIEAVAKEIASAPAYQDAGNAPMIALGDLHNATPLKVDRAMVLESIRA